MRVVQYLVMGLGGALVAGMVAWTGYLIVNTVVRYVAYGY